MLNLLLKHGSSIYGKRYGETLIMRAVKRGNVEIVQLLLHHGASIRKGCLCFAVKKENLEMVRFLLNNGASVKLVQLLL